MPAFKTRADRLRYHLRSALADVVKIIRGLEIGLQWQEQERLANFIVDEIAKAPGDPWKLAEPDTTQEPEAGERYRGGSTPDGWCKPWEPDWMKKDKS